MKKYFVRYWNDFANTYYLVWTGTDQETAAAVEAGYERITRAKAEKLCRDERWRREHDAAFSGFASEVILPFFYSDEVDWRNDPFMELNGYIVERV